jgi:hypothetical protein
MCPITLFLALAFADDAFATVKSIDELYDKAICPGTYVDLPFRESILDTPVFQELNSCDEPTPWSYNGFHRSLKTLAQRAGFKDNFTSYILRRTSANILDSKSAFLNTPSHCTTSYSLI